jgi:hypothetical protein
MSPSTPSEPAIAAAAPAVDGNLVRWVRRIHMFTGLFLGPWMLMYAASTWVMAHREFVLSFYPTKAPPLSMERELNYPRAFRTEATREEIARQIVADLGLEGRHSVSGGRNGQPLIITRQHAAIARRITYDPATRKIAVQREEFRAMVFLERMHRRRGYDQPYPWEDTWGFLVEVAVLAMVFWSLSGFWLWWELKPTRKWGTVALLAGPALFVLFLLML